MKKLFSFLFVYLLLASNSLASSAIEPIKKGDLALAKKTLRQIEQKQYDAAKKTASFLSSNNYTDTMLWIIYQKSDADNSYEEIIDLTKRHPNWPSEKSLLNRAEESLTFDIHSSKIIEFFKDGEPITGHAMRLLAEAMINSGSNNTDKINTLLRRSWMQGDFSQNDEESFIKRHKKILRQEDHIARIDRLIWEHKISAAKRIIHFVDREYSHLFVARINLIQNRRGVDASILRVSKKLINDPGLNYDRANWHKKRRNFGRAYEYLENIKTTMPNQHQWWDLKAYLIREMIEEKKYKKAYHLAKYHGNEPGGADFADSQWLAGWISLRMLNKPRQAYEHFYALYNNVSFPVSLSRGAYWAGRAAESNNNPDIAKKWYSKAAEHPTTFYGQLATLKLDSKAKIELPDFPQNKLSPTAKTQTNAMLQATHLLNKLGQHGYARRFIISATENAKSPEEMAYISLLGKSIGQKWLGVVSGKYALRQNVILKDTGWPLLAKKPDTKTPLSLVHAIIRQESGFNTNARSSANASGLMQLIPSTARRMSKLLRLRYKYSKLTDDPDYNIALGSYYLGRLIDGFKGSYILAIGSYNAGPTNVKRWIKQNGDPRELKTVEEVIDWIEMIPFSETRNYIQRVIENKQMYERLLNKRSISTIGDLMRFVEEDE